MNSEELQGRILACLEPEHELVCLSVGARHDPDATRVKWRSWADWPSEEFEVECPRQSSGYLRGRRKPEGFTMLTDLRRIVNARDRTVAVFLDVSPEDALLESY